MIKVNGALPTDSVSDTADLSWRSSPRHHLTHPPMQQGKHRTGGEFHLFCPLLRPQRSELRLGQSRSSEIFVNETGTYYTPGTV